MMFLDLMGFDLNPWPLLMVIALVVGFRLGHADAERKRRRRVVANATWRLRGYSTEVSDAVWTATVPDVTVSVGDAPQP